MAGSKETYEIELNPDQMAFIRQMKDEYRIRSDSKAVRAVIDYLITTPDVRDEVFKEMRCLRCE